MWCKYFSLCPSSRLEEGKGGVLVMRNRVIDYTCGGMVCSHAENNKC